MATTVRDLMSAPAVTCDPHESLAGAAGRMQGAGIGSVVVAEDGKVVGIFTERDLLRAATAAADAATEPVRMWMTANPNVLAPDDDAGSAWASLHAHHYRHLPVVDRGRLSGVVSMRDLFSVAQLRPAAEVGVDLPRGLAGVVVAETGVGDVRGEEGFYHYRQYSAVELAMSRSLEDVWYLLSEGTLPGSAEASRFTAEVASLRALPPRLQSLLPALSDVAVGTPPLDTLRTAISTLGDELHWQPTHDIDPATLRAQTLRLCAVLPTIITATHRLRNGLEPIAPDPKLGYAANYLFMLHGRHSTPERVRALEQYLITTIDHGFNASTFTARVIASTGADLAAAVVGAIGALSGPLHGGAPSRALDMLDDIGSTERAESWLRDAVANGSRIMGFGHRVYKTEDPRSRLLRDVARDLNSPLFELTTSVERAAVEVLGELKPGRRLYANVELYAGVVMDACTIPREMFTPTFAASRAIGWTTHIREQAADNRLIRPAARYAGPSAPQPVPAAAPGRPPGPTYDAGAGTSSAR